MSACTSTLRHSTRRRRVTCRRRSPGLSTHADPTGSSRPHCIRLGRFRRPPSDRLRSRFGQHPLARPPVARYPPRMSWLTEYVRPKIRTLFARSTVPDNLWHQCPSCQQMIFHRDLAANLKVCPHCGHHMRASSTERLDWTFDDNAYTRIELPKPVADPLRFRDTKRYTDRLKEAREKTHTDDAITVAHGTIGGHKAVVAVMEFEFIGGSMGAAVGDAVVAAARLAELQQVPLIVFTASGGARMQEGAISLMQMPRTVIATRLVKDAGLPFIVVMTDPTTGGVTASFAMPGAIP